MRHRSLIYLGHSLVVQLPDEQRHRYGNNNIEYDKRDIIAEWCFAG
ncbi:MAG: hypothetical protein ACLSA0_22905 [Eisenbergiella massiliensis]